MPDKKDIIIKDNGYEVAQLSAIGGNNDLYFLFKKAERISSATYMITNFFAPEEPLKWSLRNVSVSVLRDIIDLYEVSLSKKEGLKRSLVSKVVELASIFEIAYTAGFVSHMNFDLLKSEIMSLLSKIELFEAHQKTAKSINFGGEYFSVADVSAGLVSKGQRDIEMSDSRMSLTNRQPHTYLRDRLVSKPGLKGHSAVLAKQGRDKAIIDLLKKKDKAGIKDFVQVIRDCSEKTIQRELLSLVEKNVLKKEGERRWSTYSLVRG